MDTDPKSIANQTDKQSQSKRHCTNGMSLSWTCKHLELPTYLQHGLVSIVGHIKGSLPEVGQDTPGGGVASQRLSPCTSTMPACPGRCCCSRCFWQPPIAHTLTLTWTQTDATRCCRTTTRYNAAEHEECRPERNKHRLVRTYSQCRAPAQNLMSE